MVAIAVAGMMAVSIVRFSLVARRAGRVEAWRVQADWLAESALERAAARLASDSTYKGETWTIPADAFDGSEDAAVKIDVAAVADQPDRRAVSVRADYPNHSHNRARQVKQTVLHISPKETEQ